MMNKLKIPVFLFAVLSFADLSAAHAGMPSPLPTNWTKDHKPSWAGTEGASAYWPIDARLQAISFFVACLLLSAWGLKWLWLVLRHDFPWLPVLDYRRAFCLTVLWGLLFVIVLTMISGARELMTPGAWRKQGWTYRLAETPETRTVPDDSREQRLRGLERLRSALWQYAATHQGRFPTKDDPTFDGCLWDLPGWPGLQFLLVPEREASDAPQLLVFEPEIEGDERQVILTNGQVATMRSSEIRQALSERRSP